MLRPDAITLKQLRSLSAIHTSGSVTAAAEKLNVTAPAVSTQLRLLEENFAGKLLERGPTGYTELTEEGAIVLETVEAIEQALDKCLFQLEALRNGKSGHVAIGVVSTGKYFAPGLLKQAQTTMPGIDFSLRIGNRDQIRQALKDETIDVAIMGRPPREPAVDATALGDHPYIIVVPPEHSLLKKDHIETSDLLDEVFLCREPGSGTRILTERFIDRIGEGYPIRTLELGSNETIKQGVIAGLGIAMISAHTVANELATGRLVSLRMEGLPIMRHWFLIRAISSRKSVAVSAFEDFLISQNGSFLPPPLPL